MSKYQSPCDLCAFFPPSSFDGKPCSMCPAIGKQAVLDGTWAVEEKEEAKEAEDD